MESDNLTIISTVLYKRTHTNVIKRHEFNHVCVIMFVRSSSITRDVLSVLSNGCFLDLASVCSLERWTIKRIHQNPYDSNGLRNECTDVDVWIHNRNGHNEQYIFDKFESTQEYFILNPWFRRHTFASKLTKKRFNIQMVLNIQMCNLKKRKKIHKKPYKMIDYISLSFKIIFFFSFRRKRRTSFQIH